MRLLLVFLLVPLLLVIPAFAESQTAPTDQKTLDVKISYENIIPGELSRLPIEFINPVKEETQIHIDYKILITKSGEIIFKTPSLIHTSEGLVNGLKVEFPEDGVYTMDVAVEGILFTPIPPETASFEIKVGDVQTEPKDPSPPDSGCLIATATYGTELAPQVQLLREIRDSKLFSTTSGTAFMSGFNTLYYSFAPTVADWERESPIFKEVVKTMITPMLSTLSIMSLADEGSEAKVLGLGISVIALNLAMYIGIPAFGILKVYQTRKN